MPSVFASLFVGTLCANCVVSFRRAPTACTCCDSLSSFFFFLNNSNTKNEISTANLAQEELVNYFFFFMLLRDAIRLLRCSLFYLSCPFSSSSSFCFTRVLCPVSHREYGVTRARTLLFFFLCLSLTRSSENKTKQKQSKGGNRGTRSMKRGEGRARPSKMPKM